MNDNAKAWVKALRSGDYHQGEGRLRKNDSFCCLGVACDIFIKAGGELKVTQVAHVSEHINIYSYNETAYVLPDVVQAWLGLDNEHGYFGDIDADGIALTDMNDDLIPFDEIADTIESEPKGLFA